MYCGFYNIIYVREKTVLFIFSFLFQYQKHYLHEMFDRILLKLINRGVLFQSVSGEFYMAVYKSKGFI